MRPIDEEIRCNFPDVGITSMKDLTKDELIECLWNVCLCGETYLVNRLLLNIVDRRREKKIREEEAKFDKWHKSIDEYISLLKPYDGKKIKEIPPDVIQKADELERKIQKAGKAYLSAFWEAE